MNVDKQKQVAVKVIKEVGDILIKKFQTFDRHDIKLKDAQEIVTEYDLMSEEIIIKAIKNNFPDHGILAEESGSNSKESDWLWAIDPIDGTTNFSMHNPLWCVSIGLMYKNELVLGVIYAPLLNELYVAVKGCGAFLNNKPIKVSEIKQGKILHSFCWGRGDENTRHMFSYLKNQKMNGSSIRHLGTAAIELAFVSAGRLESFILPNVKLWDVAAGILLVKEAGGRVTDFKGQLWNIESKNMVASNNLVHEKILTVLNESKD
jgi:myo-inositol-1(or 4)-monophosphatase